MYLPKELLHMILEYDGRIKYTNGKYVNILHKHDERYNIIQPLITNKLVTIKGMEIHGQGFHFDFGFSIVGLGLCYDYNFSYKNTFEICYYDFRDYTIKQIRTYL